MFEKMQNYIVEKLFGRAILEYLNKHKKGGSQSYYDTSEENITAMISQALSIIAFGDCSVSVNLDNGSTKRTEFLNDIAEKEFSKAKRKVASALGLGMIASIPYCTDNGLGKKIYIDTIGKDRFFITGVQGDEITEITAIADTVTVGEKKYTRWTDYSVNNGVYTIRNKATNESGKEVPLESVEKWKGIQPEISIGGVDRLPVAIFKCPSGGRRPDGIEGVPITYGCDATLNKIKTTLKDIEREFAKKKVKIIAPRSMLLAQRDENGKIIGKTFDDDLYEKVADSDEQNKVIVFDPAFKESAYYFKLNKHFEMAEKEIGCSPGILTQMVTHGATATEIKRANNSTFCLTDDIRKEYMNYFENLIYSVNVLCNYYNLTPISDYKINYDWNYSLLEDSSETWQQLKDGQSMGLRSKAELRAWQTGESIEEAQKKIDEITKQEPPLQTLIGMSE